MRVALKLAYTPLPKDADEVKTSVALIRHAVNQKYPQGMPRVELRLWAKIEDQLDAPENDGIELTPTQWVFLKDAAQAATWPPTWARLAVTFLDALDEMEKSF